MIFVLYSKSMPYLVLQVGPLYVYIYSPERLNNTTTIFRQSLSLPTLLHGIRAAPNLDLAAAPLPHRAAPGEVDLHDLRRGPRRPY
jgi:hypothetical protein